MNLSAITADTALRLSALFGTTIEFWLKLQNAYDLKSTEIKLGKKIKKEVVNKDAAWAFYVTIIEYYQITFRNFELFPPSSHAQEKYMKYSIV